MAAKYSTLPFFIFYAHIIFSQDTIYFKSNNIQVAKIDSINSTEIKYHLFDNLSGPVHIIYKKEISKIVFNKGMVQYFLEPEDISNESNTFKDSIRFINKVIKFFDNRYGPFHQKIKYEDEFDNIVSDFGYYFSTGLGGGGNKNNNSGLAELASFSFAYKSHIISISGGHYSNSWGEPARGYTYNNANYYGISIGESLRFRWLLLSGTIGIGASSVNIYSYDPYPYINYTAQNFYSASKVLSMPIECKFFYTAPCNGIGVGIHMCEDILDVSKHVPGKYNSFYFGICIVTGFWSKA